MHLWLQDSDWSRALRDWLERWLGETLTFACGTDGPSQHRCHKAMTRSGFDVRRMSVDYEVELTLDQVVGESSRHCLSTVCLRPIRGRVSPSRSARLWGLTGNSANRFAWRSSLADSSHPCDWARRCGVLSSVGVAGALSG